MSSDSKDTDVDPKRMDVTDGPAHISRRKTSPPPTVIAEQTERARARAMKRPISPGVMLEPNKRGGFTTTSPHSDLAAWELQLADAFGTRSASVMKCFIQHLRSLVAESWHDQLQQWKPNETELNAALAMIAGQRPRNEAEAALAAQMVAVHWMQMRISAQALKHDRMDGRDAAIAGRLARTFVMQVEAMEKLKGRGRSVRQSITVRKELHQHVHYHRGDGEVAEQPQAKPAQRIEGGSEVPGESADGKVVPLASRARKTGL